MRRSEFMRLIDIDVDKLIEYINSLSSNMLCEWDTIGVLDAIYKQPIVDAELIHHGCNENMEYAACDEFRCSECGAIIDHNKGG